MIKHLYLTVIVFPIRSSSTFYLLMHAHLVRRFVWLNNSYSLDSVLEVSDLEAQRRCFSTKIIYIHSGMRADLLDDTTFQFIRTTGEPRK